MTSSARGGYGYERCRARALRFFFRFRPDPNNKFRSKQPLTFCVNKKGTGLPAQFLKNRNKVIREMKKKNKRPKPATIEKYRFTEHELSMHMT